MEDRFKIDTKAFAREFNKGLEDLYGHPACRPDLPHAKPCGPVPWADDECACGCRGDDVYCMTLPEHERR